MHVIDDPTENSWFPANLTSIGNAWSVTMSLRVCSLPTGDQKKGVRLKCHGLIVMELLNVLYIFAEVRILIHTIMPTEAVVVSSSMFFFFFFLFFFNKSTCQS